MTCRLVTRTAQGRRRVSEEKKVNTSIKSFYELKRFFDLEDIGARQN